MSVTRTSASKATHRSSLLLAKSAPRGRPPVTLIDHSGHVMDAFAGLFGTPDEPTPLTQRWLVFFRLGLEQSTNFIRHGLVAALAHDWGKANDGFQQMLQGRGRQLLRHEQVSAILLEHDRIRNWLSADGLDVSLILAAVLGHHLKARETTFGTPQGGFDPLILRWDDSDLRDGLVELATRVPLPGPLPEDIPAAWSFEGLPGTADLGEALDAVRDRLYLLDRELREDSTRKRMLWAVRAALIAADAAGSALPREGQGIRQWLRQAFFAPRCYTDTDDGRMTAETVRRAILLPRLEEIGIDEADLNPFQQACGDAGQVPRRALLLAPCGSGKTLAAWQWIIARCNEQPRRRIIFLYPTRGTATEGYRDYVAHAGPEEAALVHGTADLDLDGIHADIPIEERINEARLFALRQWPKRLFSATVDQFLGFLQHGYGPTCHLPLLVDSVIVFDEVHSYDRGMFSALTEFLRNFDVPVLCMTATILEGRRKKLLDLGLTYVNGLQFGSDDGESALKKVAEYARYRVTRVAGREEAEEAVRDALKSDKRVLWVVNTVERCQQIARDFARDPEADRLVTEDGVPVFCYHSRYRLVDRRAWHEAVVRAFKSRQGQEERSAVLAVTTQVCEMSLDLDADLLVTELCPAPALVQRMGRCCRDSTAHETGRTGKVLIYDPPGDHERSRYLPYGEKDMEGVGQMVDAMVEERRISQARLEQLLDDIRAPVELPKACRFIESGPWADSGEEQFRDITDLSRPALLAEDLDEYARLRDPRKRGDDPPWRADELVVSVPKRYTQPHGHPAIPSWLHLATGGVYRLALGYCAGDDDAAGPLIV